MTEPATALPFPFDRTWDIETAVPMACILEASAPKAGNVHPRAAFSDMHFGHFTASALAAGRSLSDLGTASVGQVVLDAVEATRNCVGRNTNLGTWLLFGPLLKAVAGPTTATNLAMVQERVSEVLGQLTASDSQLVYRAIATAKPGGMGRRQQDDVAGEAPDDLVTAMAQVAGVDAVARQYCGDFADVFNRLVPWFEETLASGVDVPDAICRLQVRWLAHEMDGLIVRKVGERIARQVKDLAQVVEREQADCSDQVLGLESYRRLDAFLRVDGHRRNPGTTADLLAATLLLRLLLPPAKQ